MKDTKSTVHKLHNHKSNKTNLHCKHSHYYFDQSSLEKFYVQKSLKFNSDLIKSEQYIALSKQLPQSFHSALQKRKNEWLMSRCCLALACKELGLSKDLEISNDSNGAPIWPQGFTGSITHSYNFASAIIAKKDKILSLGIDTEKIMDDSIIADIRSIYLPDEETLISYHEENNNQNRQQMFTIIFSAKESIYKCLNPIVKSFFDYHDVVINKIDFSKRIFYAVLLTDLSNDFRKGHQITGTFDVDESYVHTKVILSRR